MEHKGLKIEPGEHSAVMNHGFTMVVIDEELKIPVVVAHIKEENMIK